MHAKPKKSLGQNFLVDKNIQQKIISVCGFDSSDAVLEIGSGRGELTSLIARNAGRVWALEIDNSLCSGLRDVFQGHKNVEIINKDILKFDIGDYFDKQGISRLQVFGNIPYYITTPILEQLLKSKDKIENIFLTVQKEFAQRIAALPGGKEYGSFSCFIQYHTEPRVLFHIKKNSFFPVPKVDSSFLRLKIRESSPVMTSDEAALFKIIRAAFGKRRKTLRNSLKGIISGQKLQAFFEGNNININVRPEDLSLENFGALSKFIEKEK